MNESQAQSPPRYWPSGARLGVPAGFRALPRPVLWLALLAAGLLLLAVAAQLGVGPRAAPVPADGPSAATRLVARGQVRPVSYARIATLAGGTVIRLTVEVGDQVGEEQEIARVRGAQGTEVVTAPWAGTVTSLPVHFGDTVLPGATIATVGDLSRLRIETSDVDEFLIAHVRRGQWVRLTVDALDDYPLQGYVRSVALHQETTALGDEHYPVVIELAESVAALRPGMTVRVDFAE
jgi:multidrug efflux pump subunit AcrA (membrane-fusion protein)